MNTWEFTYDENTNGGAFGILEETSGHTGILFYEAYRAKPTDKHLMCYIFRRMKDLFENNDPIVAYEWNGENDARLLDALNNGVEYQDLHKVFYPKDDYIEIEATCLDGTIPVHLKDNHIFVDAYGIYPSHGTVVADMPLTDWEELCNREEYENDLKELAEYNDDTSDENVSFTIPFNKLSEGSLKVIQRLMKQA